MIAPLDWGLGHATRCVPLIQKFLSVGFKVIIAAEGDQKILLQSMFPHIELVEIKGYRIKYGSTKLKTILKIFFQIPKILIAINSEKKWLARFVAEKHLDAIVSDNRFGLHHKSLISVFITHQLGIKTSLGKFADKIAQLINYQFINRFDYCWVPDSASDVHLAGALSHPPVKPATHDLAVQWRVNGVLAGRSPTFSLNTLRTGLGNHTVSVEVSDPTAAVRRDPGLLLKSVRQWTVTVTPPLAPTILGFPERGCGGSDSSRKARAQEVFPRASPACSSAASPGSPPGRRRRA